MRALHFAALLWLAAVPTVHACVNSVATDQQGKRFHANDYVGTQLEKYLTVPSERSHWIQRSAQITRAAREKPNLHTLTDLGVVLIYHGRYSAAIRHFLNIEKWYPGRPETAANLGTALELAGDNETALKWIRIGMQRNPGEHHGTEWLHARILETKIALEKDPNHLQSRSIAGLNFDSTLLPALPQPRVRGNSNQPLTARDVDLALRYQLGERLAFVKPPDPIVANLLQDWATLNLAGGPLENAGMLYRLALRYGAQPTPLMKQRQAYVEKTIAAAGKAEVKEHASCALCTAPPPPPSP